MHCVKKREEENTKRGHGSETATGAHAGGCGSYMNPAPPVMRILSGTKSSSLDSKVVDSWEASHEALLSNTGFPLPTGTNLFCHPHTTEATSCTLSHTVLGGAHRPSDTPLTTQGESQ